MSRLASILEPALDLLDRIPVAQTLAVAGASDFSWTLSAAQACPKAVRSKWVAELSLDKAKGELNAWPAYPPIATLAAGYLPWKERATSSVAAPSLLP
jgi:hypothetical protein